MLSHQTQNTMKDLVGILVSNCVIFHHYGVSVTQAHLIGSNYYCVIWYFTYFYYCFVYFYCLEHTVGDQLDARNAPDKTSSGQANDAIIEHQSTDGITPNNEHHHGGPGGCISK